MKYRSSWRTAIFALLAAFALVRPAQAQTTTSAGTPDDTPLKEIQVARGAFVRGAPLPPWADPLPLPPATTSRQPVVIRLSDTQFRVTPEPTILVNRAEQVNDAAALGRIGQVPLHFAPQFQRLLLHSVRIVRGEHVLDRTGDTQVRFLQRETGLEQGVYSGVITASLLVEDVRAGDTLHLMYSLVGANPVFGDLYSEIASWDQRDPMELRRVTLWHPAQRKLAWRMLGDNGRAGVKPTVSTEAGWTRLRFEERNVAAVEDEANTPSSFKPFRYLQFSEFDGWRGVAQWAEQLFTPTQAQSAELKQLVERFGALPTPEQRTAAALEWVQSEIRYYSIALGESSHRPRQPDEVLKHRFGDCKDKTFLLMTLLRAMSIDAQPVLASLGSHKGLGALLPSPEVFDHAVLLVRIGERSYFLDPTRQGQKGKLDRMGQGLEGAEVLVVAPQTSALTTVRSANVFELVRNELRETVRLSHFDGDGELEVAQSWHGTAAESLRISLRQASAEQLARFAISGYERRYAGLTPLAAPQLQDDADNNRFTLIARFKVPKLISESHGSWVLRFFPNNLNGSLPLPETLTRKFPVALGSHPFEARYSLEVHWPESVSVVSDTPVQRMNTPQFDAEYSESFRGNVQRASMQMSTRTDVLTPAELPRVVEDVRKLERMVGGVLVVERQAIKSAGFLGLGRKTLQDSLRERLKDTVERTSRTIAGGKLQGDDLAEALCNRAEARADLGEAAAGLQDAQEAVRAAASLPRAWLCRANLLFANGEFAQAVPDYTRSVTLGNTDFATYLRRGHARFYAGKLEQAAEDFARAASERKGDTARGADRLHALLWQAWALQRLGQPLPGELAALAAKEPRGSWPRPALAMLTGALTPEQMLSEADKQRGDDRELALAEAWFYLGQHHLATQQLGEARAAFEKAREKGITHYVEHLAAGFELQRLGGGR